MKTNDAPRRVPAMRVALDEHEIEAVADVLRSGALREGPLCRTFEERFADHVGAGFAVSASSGTAALHLAYEALLNPDDEVLVPAFTFIATASMVVKSGARPVFCDVDPAMLTIDVDDARRRITPKTTAIAPVHLFGNPCDVDAVRALADEHGLKIVWDAAQAHGARYGGTDIGAFDDVVCYSFYPSKNMTTAEGGMITTNDAALAERMRLLRAHGASGKYLHTVVGYNYRLTDVMAALGLRQLESLPSWIKERRANAETLAARLRGTSGVTLPVEQPGGESSYNLYTIVVDPGVTGIDRDAFVASLQAAGIGATVHYPRPLHRQPALEAFAPSSPLPVSERLSEQVLSLPVYPGLTADEIAYVGDTVATVAAGWIGWA